MTEPTVAVLEANVFMACFDEFSGHSGAKAMQFVDELVSKKSKIDALKNSLNLKIKKHETLHKKSTYKSYFKTISAFKELINYIDSLKNGTNEDVRAIRTLNTDDFLSKYYACIKNKHFSGKEPLEWLQYEKNQLEDAFLLDSKNA